MNKILTSYDSKLSYGMSLVVQKNYIEAKKIFKNLTTADSKRYEAYLNLSNIESILNNFDKSEKILKKFLSKNIYNRFIVEALANLYFNISDKKKLKFLINYYLDIKENHILYYFKAILSEEDAKINDSIFFFNKTIKMDNKFWPAYEKLFSLYEKTEKFDEFKKLIETSEKLFNNNYQLLYFKALLEQRTNNNKRSLDIINDNYLENNFLKNSNINYLINLYDLFSKIYLKLKKYNYSLNYAIKRNEINLKKSNNIKYNKRILLDIIKKYKIFYNSYENIKIKNNSTLKHNNLTFLVGFPRSGTTLLDSILRSHSKTIVLEEKPYLINIRHEFYKINTLEKILSISDKLIIEFQEKYFKSFDYSEKKLIIDKFPLNLIELGFIKKIFPNSKIILALRHPLDSILSCVLTSFKINEAMANYENLETTAYFYNEIFHLFKIYKNVLNLNYHEVKYENVVHDFDNTIKNLLNYLNLDNESNLKKFYITAKNRDRISTPSYNQVTQPIYTKSINRYKNFEKIEKIKPLIKYWINEFNYEEFKNYK
tara:strand:+ start:375 stop:2000 length:1626 start_codon:yes stop_codon:yes gene_type:complete